MTTRVQVPSDGTAVSSSLVTSCYRQAETERGES